MKGYGSAVITVAAALGLALAGCGSETETPPMGEVHGEMPGGMEGMDHMPGMPMDSGLMQRHAQEADSMATVMRQHLDRMRQLGAGEWYAQMSEHVGHASRMLTLMNRQMREMGMDVSDEHMGQMMGMSAEEHRQMMTALQALRSDLEQLQTAPPAEVRELMPAHLDRVEDVVGILEQSAEHMRSM